MKLNVIMPVHNGLPYLREAVASVLSQTYQDFRFIIVDDGSTDHTLEYLQTINDGRVVLEHSDCRQGQGAARNLAIRHCTSEFVAFMDADDIALPQRFEVQIDRLEQQPTLGLLGTFVRYLGPTGRTGFPPPLPINHTEIRRELMAGNHALVNGTIMLRTNVLRTLGGYRIEGAGEDWDFFLRASEVTALANVPEHLYLYRLHPHSTNARDTETVRLRIAHACCCAKLREMGNPEIGFPEFCAAMPKAQIHISLLERLDSIALGQYRTALEEVLSGSAAKGYARLAFAACLSPRRLLRRARRSAHARYTRRPKQI